MGANERSKGRTAYVASRPLRADAPRRAMFSQRLSIREQAEREVAAHIAVAEALAAWEQIDGGLASLLAALGEALDYEVGVLWVPRDGRLRPRAFWQGAAGDLGEFKVMTLTSRLRRGAELPGQVWEHREPGNRTRADGPGPLRWRTALAAGFREAIAFPVIAADEMIAVIELVSRAEPELTERLKRSLGAIGHVLGDFLAHRRGLLEEQVITHRQVEILELAAQGLSGPQIAERLVLSHSTVKTHFENSYARLGVKSRAAAVAEAIRLGLVS
jgi:DNA-binding CsgD family transcriptional regulator